MSSRNLFMRQFLAARNWKTKVHTNCPYQSRFLSGVESATESNENHSINYKISKDDFKWVERLLPPSIVPSPPEHATYPTPSGWIAPSNPPNKPYFVRRDRYHILPVMEMRKPKNSTRWMTVVRYVEGDIWALEKELIELVQPQLDYDPATRVHELTQSIWIKGVHEDIITKYLYDLGF
ncbi:large ribosomal subunit protein mL49-like isoform X2 [Styela clava]